jgi:hypothetical protein
MKYKQIWVSIDRPAKVSGIQGRRVHAQESVVAHHNFHHLIYYRGQHG